jgi:hypothetical protein
MIPLDQGDAPWLVEPPFAPLSLLAAAYIGYCINRKLLHESALLTWVPSAISIAWAVVVSLEAANNYSPEPFCDDCWGNGWGGFFLFSALSYSFGAWLALRRPSGTN